MYKTIIGVNLEGRHLEIGRFKNERIESLKSFTISHDKEAEIVVQEIQEAIDGLFNEQVAGIGIGVPGVIDIDEGIVKKATNISSWKNVPLRKLLENRYKVPIYIANDAKCFTAGIKHFGKGKNYQHLIGLIIGTGMGAGIIIDGKLWEGPNGNAGEFGKIPYLKHDYEFYCSDKFFTNIHHIAFDTLMEKLDAEDSKSKDIIEEFGKHLAYAIYTIINSVDPQIIVLGGKLSRAFPYFENSMKETLAYLSDSNKNVIIKVNDNPKVSLIGASALYYDAQIEASRKKSSELIKRAEMALEETEVKYFNIFNKIQDPVFIYDQKTYKFLDCNERVVKKVYGYTLLELRNMTPLDLHPKHELTKVRKSLNISHPDIPFSFTHVKKNGKKMQVEILSDEILYEGRKARINLVRDVTEKKKRDELEKRKAAQAAIVNEIGKRISRYLEPDKLLKEIVKEVRNAFDYYSVILLLFDEKKQRLNLTAAAGAHAKMYSEGVYLELGEGMTGRAALTKKIQLSNDVRKNPDFVKKAEEKTKSELAVPLLIAEKVIGVLDFASEKLNRFDESDVDVALALSSQIAVAIENARLFEQAKRELSQRKKAEAEARRRATYAALINEVSKRLSSNLDLDNLLTEIVDSVRDAFDYYGVMLLLWDTDKQKYVLQSIAGGYVGVFPTDLSIANGEGMIGKAAETLKVQMSNDVTQDPNYVKKSEEITLSELSVPLVSDNKVIGVLDIQVDKKNVFDDLDVTALETLSAQITAAIENARLFKQANIELVQRRKAEREAKRRAAYASLINEISRRVSKKLKISALLSEIVNSVRETFDYYGVMILLYNKKKKAYVLQSISGGYEKVFPVDLSIKMGEGMIGKAAKTREIQMSNDVTKNPDYVKKAGELTRSELAIPLVSGDKVIGVLDMQSDKPNAFDELNVSSAETLSSQLASVIVNARLFEQAQHEIKERRKTETELLKSKYRLESAKKETDNILDNVQEGFFILDSNLKIGTVYSKALEKILGISDLAHQSFLEILESRIIAKKIEGIEDYLKLLFDESFDPKMLEDLNPINEVEMNIIDDMGIWKDSRFLSFKFKRITTVQDDVELPQLITTVVDITEQKILADRLKESEQKNKKQYDLLVSILHVEAPLLKDFMESTKQELAFLDSVLKNTEDKTNLMTILEDIYRSIHLIKGNASLLDLNFFVTITHECEDLISKIKENTPIKSSDFIPLVIKIADIQKSTNEVYKLIDRLTSFQTHFRPKRHYENTLLVNSINNLITRLANDSNKKIRFVSENFDSSLIPIYYRLMVKEILVQLVRNAVAHGIETPEERIKHNKSEEGCINLSSHIENNHLIITLRDDGRGIQLKKLKEKAVLSGKFNKDEVETWTNKQIVQLIFEQGISTSDVVDPTSGRGVGLDIIKRKIVDNKGKIRIDFQEGRFCEFTILLPASRKK